MSKNLKDSFAFPLLNPLVSGSINRPMDFESKIISFKRVDSNCTTTCEYAVSDTSCAFLLDMFGHEIIIIPNDSITIDIKQKDAGSRQLPFMKFTGHDLVYSGKNKYVYSLFDSLWTAFGDLRFENITLKDAGDSLNTFFNLETERYLNRIDYVEGYAKRHSIPPYFITLAKAEIYSAYIDDLLGPTFNVKYEKHTFPKAYLDTLDHAKLANEFVYFKTFLYSKAAFSYFGYSGKSNPINFIHDKDAYFRKFYSRVVNECKVDMRNHLLVHLFEWNAKNRIGSYDSLLSNFKSILNNPGYERHLDSVISIETTRRNNIERISLEQALNCSIQDLKGNKTTIQKLLSNGKPTIIDCWASWCGPCIAEMPFEKKFENQYGDKINFIYLSFDRNEKDWQAKAKALKMIKNSYLSPEGFKSDFALHFGIDYIPHYLMFDNNGKLVNPHAGKPRTEEFGSEIQKILLK